MSNVIVVSNNLYDNLFSEISDDFIFIKDKSQLTYKNLKNINPKYIFFPHWSYIIPKEIYENFECVIFHMTDLPFGRGGSPLQNLISREIYETKISALRCVKELDAGPIYMKKSLSLEGKAQDIYLRAGSIINEMLFEIIDNNPIPKPQAGDPVLFKRRSPEEGDIKHLKTLNKVYDYIRMLDAEGYPNAFLETDGLKFEFKDAALNSGRIVAEVIITEKVNNE